MFIEICLCAFFVRFLNVKIQEGDAHNIFCPAYECYQLVPVHVIQSVVSREMDERYLHFDIKVKKITYYITNHSGVWHSYQRLRPLFLFLLRSYLHSSVFSVS